MSPQERRVVSFETPRCKAQIELDPGEDAYRAILQNLGTLRGELRRSRHPRIACYGASRGSFDDPAYAKAYAETKELCRMLAAAGIDIVTGAGQGMMEAANCGAKDGLKARSIGLPIKDALDGNKNPHVDDSAFSDHFFDRFNLFDLLATIGYFCGPRVGIGTDAEAGIVWQLAQFKLLNGRSFVMVGDYWKRRRDLMLEFMVKDGTATEAELSLPTIVDNVLDAYPIFIAQFENFKLKIAAA